VVAISQASAYWKSVPYYIGCGGLARMFFVMGQIRVGKMSRRFGQRSVVLEQAADNLTMGLM
jgi:hypothetical protein